MNETRRTALYYIPCYTTYCFVFLLKISVVQNQQITKNVEFSTCSKANHEFSNNLLSSDIGIENFIDAIKGTVHQEYDTTEVDTDSDDRTDQQRINAITWYKVLDLLRSYVISKNDNGETLIPDTNTSSSWCTTADTMMTMMTTPLCSTTTINPSCSVTTSNPSCSTTTNTPPCSTTITIPSYRTTTTIQSCNTTIKCNTTTTTVAPCVVATTPESYRRQKRFGGLSRCLPSFSDVFQPNLVNLINSYQNLAVLLDSY